MDFNYSLLQPIAASSGRWQSSFLPASIPTNEFSPVRWAKVTFWLMNTIDRYLLPLVQQRPFICFHLPRQPARVDFAFLVGSDSSLQSSIWRRKSFTAVEDNWLALWPFFRSTIFFRIRELMAKSFDELLCNVINFPFHLNPLKEACGRLMWSKF